MPFVYQNVSLVPMASSERPVNISSLVLSGQDFVRIGTAVSILLLVWRTWRFVISPWLYPQYPRLFPYWIPCKLFTYLGTLGRHWKQRRFTSERVLITPSHRCVIPTWKVLNLFFTTQALCQVAVDTDMHPGHAISFFKDSNKLLARAK